MRRAPSKARAVICDGPAAASKARARSSLCPCHFLLEVAQDYSVGLRRGPRLGDRHIKLGWAMRGGRSAPSGPGVPSHATVRGPARRAGRRGAC